LDHQHEWHARFLRLLEQPVDFAFGEHRRPLRAIEAAAQAEHASLLAPSGDALARAGPVHVEPAHDTQAIRIILRGFEAQVVAIAVPRRRNEYRAVDARTIH